MQAEPSIAEETTVLAPLRSSVAAGAVAYAYTIPGLNPGDSPILITFRRNPAVVLREMAREMLSLHKNAR